MKYFFDTEFLEGKQKDYIKIRLANSLSMLYIATAVIMFGKNTSFSIVIGVCLVILGFVLLVEVNEIRWN